MNSLKMKLICMMGSALIATGCATRVITATRWKVVRIIDGDTFTIDGYDAEETSIRIVGIDTPERGEEGFVIAGAYLRSLIEGRTVELSYPARRKRDHFGRLLANVKVDGVDVATEILKEFPGSEYKPQRPRTDRR